MAGKGWLPIDKSDHIYGSTVLFCVYAPLIVGFVTLIFTLNWILATISMLGYLPIMVSVAFHFYPMKSAVPLTEFQSMAIILTFGLTAHHLLTFPICYDI